MQSKYFHKTLTMLVMAAAFFTLSQNANSAVSSYTGERFTDTGKKDSSGIAIVRWEQGTLFVSQGFIPETSDEYSASRFNLDPTTLSAVSGKFVDRLSTWTAYSQQSGFLDAYQRSTGSYSINGVPYVIISVKGSSSLPGNSCSSTVTAIAEGLPVLTLSTPQPNAAETGPISGRFQIDLDAPRATKTTVFFTISGSASNGKDYKKIKNSVAIPAGTTSAYVDITPTNDSKQETTETVVINLNPSAAYSLSTETAATINISDND